MLPIRLAVNEAVHAFCKEKEAEGGVRGNNNTVPTCESTEMFRDRSPETPNSPPTATSEDDPAVNGGDERRNALGITLLSPTPSKKAAASSPTASSSLLQQQATPSPSSFSPQQQQPSAAAAAAPLYSHKALRRVFGPIFARRFYDDGSIRGISFDHVTLLAVGGLMPHSVFGGGGGGGLSALESFLLGKGEGCRAAVIERNLLESFMVQPSSESSADSENTEDEEEDEDDADRDSSSSFSSSTSASCTSGDDGDDDNGQRPAHRRHRRRGGDVGTSRGLRCGVKDNAALSSSASLVSLSGENNNTITLSAALQQQQQQQQGGRGGGGIGVSVRMILTASDIDFIQTEHHDVRRSGGGLAAWRNRSTSELSTPKKDGRKGRRRLPATMNADSPLSPPSSSFLSGASASPSSSSASVPWLCIPRTAIKNMTVFDLPARTFEVRGLVVPTMSAAVSPAFASAQQHQQQRPSVSPSNPQQTLVNQRSSAFGIETTQTNFTAFAAVQSTPQPTDAAQPSTPTRPAAREPLQPRGAGHTPHHPASSSSLPSARIRGIIIWLRNGDKQFLTFGSPQQVVGGGGGTATVQATSPLPNTTTNTNTTATSSSSFTSEAMDLFLVRMGYEHLTDSAARYKKRLEEQGRIEAERQARRARRAMSHQHRGDARLKKSGGGGESGSGVEGGKINGSASLSLPPRIVLKSELLAEREGGGGVAGPPPSDDDEAEEEEENIMAKHRESSGDISDTVIPPPDINGGATMGASPSSFIPSQSLSSEKAKAAAQPASPLSRQQCVGGAAAALAATPPSATRYGVVAAAAAHSPASLTLATLKGASAFPSQPTMPRQQTPHATPDRNGRVGPLSGQIAGLASPSPPAAAAKGAVVKHAIKAGGLTLQTMAASCRREGLGLALTLLAGRVLPPLYCEGGEERRKHIAFCRHVCRELAILADWRRMSTTTAIDDARHRAFAASWFAYDIHKEMLRQQLSNRWGFSYANHDFALCSTYPPILVAPCDYCDDEDRANPLVCLEAYGLLTASRSLLLLQAAGGGGEEGEATAKNTTRRGAAPLLLTAERLSQQSHTAFGARQDVKGGGEEGCEEEEASCETPRYGHPASTVGLGDRRGMAGRGNAAKRSNRKKRAPPTLFSPTPRHHHHNGQDGDAEDPLIGGGSSADNSMTSRKPGLAQYANAFKYRTKSRVQTLTYYHAFSGAAILRCSQPILLDRGQAKEVNLAILKTTRARPLVVFDLRPFVNAAANAVHGGTYESSVSGLSEVRFCNIPNIHGVTTSFEKLTALCQSGAPRLQAYRDAQVLHCATGLAAAERNHAEYAEGCRGVASASFAEGRSGGSGGRMKHRSVDGAVGGMLGSAAYPLMGGGVSPSRLSTAPSSPTTGGPPNNNVSPVGATLFAANNSSSSAAVFEATATTKSNFCFVNNNNNNNQQRQLMAGMGGGGGGTNATLMPTTTVRRLGMGGGGMPAVRLPSTASLDQMNDPSAPNNEGSGGYYYGGGGGLGLGGFESGRGGGGGGGGGTALLSAGAAAVGAGGKGLLRGVFTALATTASYIGGVNTNDTTTINVTNTNTSTRGRHEGLGGDGGWDDVFAKDSNGVANNDNVNQGGSNGASAAPAATTATAGTPQQQQGPNGGGAGGGGGGRGSSIFGGLATLIGASTAGGAGGGGGGGGGGSGSPSSGGGVGGGAYYYDESFAPFDCSGRRDKNATSFPVTTPSQALQSIAETEWLDYLYLLLQTSIDVALVVGGSTVYLHSPFLNTAVLSEILCEHERRLLLLKQYKNEERERRRKLRSSADKHRHDPTIHTSKTDTALTTTNLPQDAVTTNNNDSPRASHASLAMLHMKAETLENFARVAEGEGVTTLPYHATNNAPSAANTTTTEMTTGKRVKGGGGAAKVSQKTMGDSPLSNASSSKQHQHHQHLTPIQQLFSMTDLKQGFTDHTVKIFCNLTDETRLLAATVDGDGNSGSGLSTPSPSSSPTTKMSPSSAFFFNSQQQQQRRHQQSVSINKEHFGRHAIVHCSDGWDRTSQVCALSQIMLDPYYRTIEGFCVLIEKDFVSFGHQFRLRSDYYTRVSGGKEPFEQTSPIFIQFLDAVYQLTHVYPRSFEFSEAFLLFIADLFFSNATGTFVSNCFYEIHMWKLRDETLSLWQVVSVLLTSEPFSGCKGTNKEKGGEGEGLGFNTATPNISLDAARYSGLLNPLFEDVRTLPNLPPCRACGEAVLNDDAQTRETRRRKHDADARHDEASLRYEALRDTIRKGLAYCPKHQTNAFKLALLRRPPYSLATPITPLALRLWQGFFLRCGDGSYGRGLRGQVFGCASSYHQNQQHHEHPSSSSSSSYPFNVPRAAANVCRYTNNGVGVSKATKGECENRGNGSGEASLAMLRNFSNGSSSVDASPSYSAAASSSVAAPSSFAAAVANNGSDCSGSNTTPHAAAPMLAVDCRRSSEKQRKNADDNHQNGEEVGLTKSANPLPSFPPPSNEAPLSATNSPPRGTRRREEGRGGSQGSSSRSSSAAISFPQTPVSGGGGAVVAAYHDRRENNNVRAEDRVAKGGEGVSEVGLPAAQQNANPSFTFPPPLPFDRLRDSSGRSNKKRIVNDILASSSSSSSEEDDDLRGEDSVSEDDWDNITRVPIPSVLGATRQPAASSSTPQNHQHQDPRHNPRHQMDGWGGY